MQHVLILDPFVPDAPLERALGGRFPCRRPDAPIRADEVVALVTAGVPVGEAELAAFPEVRAVATATVGYEHLDLAALDRCGVPACHCPGYCTEEVADHALACVVALLRGLPRLAASAREGAWDYEAAGPLRRIAGARLGIVGLGRIGRALATRARALGMEVLACDPLLGNEGIVAAGAVPGSLPSLLRGCDAVSLHAPNTPANRHLIGRDELRLMPAGAVLVNVARGALLDLDALVEALREGRIAGAAVDVWDVEPPPAGDPRLQTPGLLVTPHAAWYSTRSEEAMVAELAANLAALLEGREAPGRIR